MTESPKISSIQAFILGFMAIVGGNILVGHSIFIKTALQDGWIGNIIGVVIGLLLVYLYIVLADRFPNQTFQQICENVCGRLIGNLFSSLFYLYIFIITVTLIRTFVDFVLIHILPETPIEALVILFVALIIFGVRLGLETIARTAEVCFPLTILLLIILSIMNLKEIKPDYFLPMFEEGFTPILNSAVTYQGISYLQLVAFIALLPFINKSEKRRNHPLLKGAFVGGIVIVLGTALTIGIIGAETSNHIMYPTYVLAQKIDVRDFFSRVEVALAAIWFITTFFKSSIYFYILNSGLSQALELKNEKALMLPLGMIVTIYTIVVFPNSLYSNSVMSDWVTMGFIVGLGLPLILLSLSFFKKRKQSLTM